jgi:putative RNA 2'-phosphotransferase
MVDPVQISKTLSFWLRHRPDAADLTLDDGGWASSDEVLAALARALPGADWDALLNVVESNDKQRFEFSADSERIRARQGHSLPVLGNWPPTKPPETLYHGTVERFLPAILAEGLKPMRRHHVHLSVDHGTAERVGQRRGKPTILRVRSGQLAALGTIFRLADNGVWLVDHVPPTFIECD